MICPRRYDLAGKQNDFLDMRAGCGRSFPTCPRCRAMVGIRRMGTGGAHLLLASPMRDYAAASVVGVALRA